MKMNCRWTKEEQESSFGCGNSLNSMRREKDNDKDAEGREERDGINDD